LGYIAFYLLAGGIVDLEQGYALDPNQHDHWRRDVHPALKDYLYNLIGIGSVSYESAETARRALVHLPMEREIAAVALFLGGCDSRSHKRHCGDFPLHG